MACIRWGHLGLEPIHTGMPSTTATDGFSLSLSVMELVENFGLEANIVGIKSDGGGNIWVCREALESKYTNDYVFFSPKPLFTMEFLANILAGDFKTTVQSIKSYYGEVDTELTRWNMHKRITWTKKSQKGARALWDAHIYCDIKEKRLLATVSTRFEYLIHSFRSFLYNKHAIDYLYGIMPEIHDNIRARRPSLVDWEVIQMIVTSMKCIVGSIVLNQCYGK